MSAPTRFFTLVVLVLGVEVTVADDTWHIYPNNNDVHGSKPDGKNIVIIGTTTTSHDCQEKADANNATIFTWHDVHQGRYNLTCWLRFDNEWNMRTEKGHVSGLKCGGAHPCTPTPAPTPPTPPKPPTPPTPAPPPTPAAYNPKFLREDFDCKMAQLAMDFALKLQPFRGKKTFQQIADALNGRPEASCRNTTVPKSGMPETFEPIFAPSLHARSYNTFFVSRSGSDSNPGSITEPFATVQAAVDASRRNASNVGLPSTIMLRKGTYYLTSTLNLTGEDSGLTLQNYLVSI
jgi:hypothetical protein